jgi:hypothetical protein
MKKALTLSGNSKRYLPVGFIVLFALVGVILLLLSHAAAPYIAIEAETGATGGATSATDSNASGGSYLQFGTESTTPPTGTSGGCTSGGVVAPCVGSATTGASGWGTPIFDDEFANDNNQLNTSKWSYGWFAPTSTSISGPVNVTYEQDCYDPSLVSISGGYLNEAIIQKTETCKATEPYAAGYLTSQTQGNGGDLFSFTYGYAEAYMYLPAASNGQVANWPAWWMGSNDDGGSSAPYTEIDIMEGLGGTAQWHVHGQNGDTPCQGSGIGPGWHTFGVDWGPGTASFYYDGKQVGSTCNTSDLDSNDTGAMFLLLGEQTGSNAGGPIVAPSTMQTEYVRVWQQ